MPTINFKAVAWTIVIIVLLSQITAIRAMLYRVGLVFYNGVWLPIERGPEEGQVLVLSLMAALGFVVIWSFVKGRL